MQKERREGVCLSAGLRQRPSSQTCCPPSSSLGSCCSQSGGRDTSADLFRLLSGEGSVLKDQGNALSLLIQGQEGLIAAKSVLELRNTNERATLFTRGVFPES